MVALPSIILLLTVIVVAAAVSFNSGGNCILKPGAPAGYKQLCESEKTEVDCVKVNLTCTWKTPAPSPSPPTPPPIPCGPHPAVCALRAGQPAKDKALCRNASKSEEKCDKHSTTCEWKPKTPSGRPCPPKFTPTDLTGLWVMADHGKWSKSMLWMQQQTPPSCFAGFCPGATFLVTCVTGNYSADSPFTTGSSCPWETSTCTVDEDDTPDPGHHVTCSFGKTSLVVSLLLDGGTYLGPSSMYPGSGLGWRRLTGKMTGLWSPVDDNQTKTQDVYVIGHDWTDNSLRATWFPARTRAVDWQWGVGSVGGILDNTVAITFNTDAVGTLTGNLSAAGDAVVGPGGLGGWTKRSCIWTTTNLTTCSISIAGCAAGCGYLHTNCGPNICDARLPANNVGSFRNILYTSPDCTGTPASVLDVRLSPTCANYGSAGAVVGFNATSGNLSLQIYDGSDCPCGTYTPINPWSGGGGDCTCPASRCAVNTSHVLQYSIRFGDNASAAPCLTTVAHENTITCNGQRGSTPCRSQKWFLAPPAEDGAACFGVLHEQCGGAKQQGQAQCHKCADKPATWNKLAYIGCTAPLVGRWCDGGAQ